MRKMPFVEYGIRDWKMAMQYDTTGIDTYIYIIYIIYIYYHIYIYHGSSRDIDQQEYYIWD